MGRRGSQIPRWPGAAVPKREEWSRSFCLALHGEAKSREIDTLLLFSATWGGQNRETAPSRCTPGPPAQGKMRETALGMRCLRATLALRSCLEPGICDSFTFLSRRSLATGHNLRQLHVFEGWGGRTPVYGLRFRVLNIQQHSLLRSSVRWHAPRRGLCIL